jgi:Domain of unknown function (DUF1707)
MGRPGGEIAAGSGGRGHLRVSHADREQVIDALKVAFVQGRLTKDELDARAGQALVARTFAELAVVTADIPAGPDLARPPVSARTQPDRPESGAEKWAVRSGAGAILALMVAASAWAVAVGQPELIAMLVVVIGAVAATVAGFVAIVVSVVWMLTPESRQRKSSGGQLPPRSASGPGGQASQQPVSADPAGQFPPVDHGQQHWLLTRKRQIPDSRKHGNAGAQPLAWTVGDITC